MEKDILQAIAKQIEAKHINKEEKLKPNNRPLANVTKATTVGKIHFEIKGDSVELTVTIKTKSK